MKKIVFTTLILLPFLTAGQSWMQIQKKVPNDRESLAGFGFALNIQDSLAFIAAAFDPTDEDGLNHLTSSGSVYVFKQNGNGSWSQFHKVVASDRDSAGRFGISVSVSGNYMAVGAPYEEEDENDMNTAVQAGAVYIFEKDIVTGNWIEVKKIVPNFRTGYSFFGCDVALDSNLLMVGSSSHAYDTSNSNFKSLAGAVYFYERNATGVWNEKQKIVASDREWTVRFGHEIDFSDNRMIVGAPGQDFNAVGMDSLESAGAAYYFERDQNGIWNEISKLVASDRNENDEFGSSVYLSDSSLIIGAYFEDADSSGFNPVSNTGAAYIFNQNVSGNWTESQKLNDPNPEPSDWFGLVACINNGYLTITSRRHDNDTLNSNPVNNAGAVHVYKKSTLGIWEPHQMLVSNDRSPNAYFGSGLVQQGDVILIGAFGENYDHQGLNYAMGAGALYVFDLNPISGLFEIAVEHNWKIGPNPTRGLIELTSSRLFKNISVDVYNQIGQLVHSNHFEYQNSVSFSLDGSPGVYFIEIKYNDQKEVIRVLKQ